MLEIDYVFRKLITEIKKKGDEKLQNYPYIKRGYEIDCTGQKVKLK